MKLKIALASGESNLISLKRTVPNSDFTYFGMNPITHSPNARRLNEQLNPTVKKTEADAEESAPSTIKRRRKKKKAQSLAVPAKKDNGDGLGEKSAPGTKNVLPNGADMYYGLIPIEHNPISKMVIAGDFGSRFDLNDPVWIQFKNDSLPAEILAVTFLAGKVLYNLAVFTGFESPSVGEYVEQYGLINSIGWDSKGREYIRLLNVDSTFIIPRLEVPVEQPTLTLLETAQPESSSPQPIIIELN